ncbi:hypothetical protein HanIR_Chr09g0396051 [Helianthus annuus]|nr:hypothetical protein HanIR_Chr09g0396051 [Helianthus annuus]
MIVSECGANLVYMDVGEIEEEVNYENNMMKEEEVIGGDLSGFEVTAGGYYLCRRDVFGLQTSYWLKKFFGDNVHYPDSQGWRKTHESKMSWKLRDLKIHQTEMSWKLRDLANAFMKIIDLRVRFIGEIEIEIEEIKKAASSIVGVVTVSAQKEMGKLTVTGYVDPVEVATCLMEFDHMTVEILSVKVVFNEKEESNLIRQKRYSTKKPACIEGRSKNFGGSKRIETPRPLNISI